MPTSPCRRFIAHQSMGVRIDSQFWESLFIELLQQINQVLLILTIFACWAYFSLSIITLVRPIICKQVYQMAATLKTVAWWFGQFPYIVRRMPHPKLRPPCKFRLCHAFTAPRRRPASTLASAPGHISLNKLFLRKAIMQGLYLYIIIFWTALFYVCR